MIKKRFDNIFRSDAFQRILKANKARRIAIFGSCATGQEKSTSDVDFLVEFEDGADLLDQVGLKQDLEKLLKKDVDVVTPRSLSRYLRDKILKQAVYL